MLLMLSLLQKHDDITTPQVLDIEDDNLRKKFIRDILTDSKSSREVINVSRFYQKPKLFRHSADLLISVLQSRVLLRLVCFRLLWRTSSREQRLCRSAIFTKHNGTCYGRSLGLIAWIVSDSLYSQQQEFKKVTFSELNKLTILQLHNLWIDDQQQSVISIVISKESKLCDESQNRLESD